MKALELLKQDESKDLLRLVTAGSVDDGKSTLIGRLLYESHGIYEDQLASIVDATARKAGAGAELDLSFVTDGLKAEREQGITIDVAYRYFSTPKRKFIIADTPGHEQYTRNMATGASTAGLAVILIDARNGVTVQSKRHAFIATLLGIPHLLVAVNKMDAVGWSADVFEAIRREFADFAAKLAAHDLTFIPVSALRGDNVVQRSENMPWYQGSTLLNLLETVHVASDRNLIDLRFPVQYVSRVGDARGYMGSVASGVVRPGDEVMVLPSGARSRVKAVLGADGELAEAFAPLAATLVLEDEIDVSRGDMLVHVHNVPHVEHVFEAMLVWMAEQPLQPNRSYLIKHCTRTVSGLVSDIRYRFDVNTLHRTKSEQLGLNEIGRVVLTANKPLTFDAYAKNRSTGAFIVIDRVSNNTVGAGMILDREPSELLRTSGRWAAEPASEHVQVQASRVSADQRAGKYGQKAATVWLTGMTGAGKTTIAYELERRLFERGSVVNVIDGAAARTTLSRDLGFDAADRTENVRRVAEVAAMFNDAGLITICSLLSPYEADREHARQRIGAQRFVEVFLDAPIGVCRQRRPAVYARAEAGEIANFSGVTAPYERPERPDLTLATDRLSIEQCVEAIIARLQERGIVKSQ